MFKEGAENKNIDKLIDTVVECFNNMYQDKIDNVFLSVQGSMEDCLKTGGRDAYLSLSQLNQHSLQLGMR